MWFVYTQEKGGQKLRITGKLRTMLKSHLKFRHHYKYLETSKASHITGQGLHLLMDTSLLKKTWKPADSCSQTTARVRGIKILAGILATEAVLTRRNKGTSINGLDMAICKLCGAAEETNLHMICECTGHIDLVTERKVWICKMRKVIRTNMTKHTSREQSTVFLEL